MWSHSVIVAMSWDERTMPSYYTCLAGLPKVVTCQGTIALDHGPEGKISLLQNYLLIFKFVLVYFCQDNSNSPNLIR